MNENQEQKQWLVVKNDENKRKPYKAIGLCFVTTTNRDEEYALHYTVWITKTLHIFSLNTKDISKTASIYPNYKYSTSRLLHKNTLTG